MSCFTIRNAKALWDYGKQVIDQELAKGNKMDFPTLTQRLATDVNAAVKAAGGTQTYVPEDMARLISMPKAVKAARKGLLLSQRSQSQALSEARNFTKGTEETPLSKWFKTAYEAPYAAKVVAHGPALHMTHAWPYLLDPMAWKNFASTWVSSWKAMNESQAQRLREQIQSKSNFDEKIGSKLASDPRKVYDDVEKKAGFWGKLGRMTQNSFLGLKALRDVQWDAFYDSVPDHLKTKEMRDLISARVNHMTGASPEVPMRGTVGKIARGAFFAPSLDIARVMRMADFAKDTGVTIRDALNRAPVVGEQLKKAWGDASPEAKFVARQNMKQWARIGAVFSGILYGNQLLLKHAFGSKEDVNVSDPFKGDWMAPKGPNGRVWQMTGGQIPMIRAGTRAILAPAKAGSALGDYFMGKINPALQVAKGLATGKGFGGEALPQPLGEKPGTVGNWLTYATAELGPIATEDGIKEFSKQMSDQNGVPQDWNAKVLRSFAKAGAVTIPSVLGTHTYQPQPHQRKTHPAQPFTP